MGSSGRWRGCSRQERTSPGRRTRFVLVRRRRRMRDVTVERRGAPRYPMVLAAEVIELPRGARLSAHTADIGRMGCYIRHAASHPARFVFALPITTRCSKFSAKLLTTVTGLAW